MTFFKKNTPKRKVDKKGVWELSNSPFESSRNCTQSSYLFMIRIFLSQFSVKKSLVDLQIRNQSFSLDSCRYFLHIGREDTLSAFEYKKSPF